MQKTLQRPIDRVKTSRATILGDIRNKFITNRRQIRAAAVFCGFYTCILYKGLSLENEVIRIGIAGSLATVICDSCFHVVDTVNIRAKAVTDSGPKGGNAKTMELVREIWRKEGIRGFSKGFSATFYSAAACGFLYFSIYKYLKDFVRDLLEEDSDLAFCYMIASISAGFCTLGVAYPYDLIKCRLQSVNHVYKYQNLPHAFRKELKNNGAKSLYTGMTPFFASYCTWLALQFTVYEKTMS